MSATPLPAPFLARTKATSPALRIADHVAAGLCFVGAAMLLFLHGALAFGLVGFYAAAQSGVVHFARTLDYAFAPTVRYAATGLALGVCLNLHAFVRAFHPASYLEHLGGPTIATVAQGVSVALVHGVVPVASVLHVYRAPSVNPLPPALVAAAEVALAALAHEFVASDQPRDLDASRVGVLFASTTVSAAAWVLLLETVNRALVPELRRRCARRPA